MTTETAVHLASVPGRDRALATAYAEGIRAGLIGALTIALWFAILDGLGGRWFFTPTLLGTAIFRGGSGLDDPSTLKPSLEMVLSFTWIHVLVFLLVGMTAGRLMLLAEDDSHMGFGILLLFFVFEFGFLAACMVFAEPVLQALAWPTIAIGNLLAALAMAAIFWRGHRGLSIAP